MEHLCLLRRGHSRTRLRRPRTPRLVQPARGYRRLPRREPTPRIAVSQEPRTTLRATYSVNDSARDGTKRRNRHMDTSPGGNRGVEEKLICKLYTYGKSSHRIAQEASREKGGGSNDADGTDQRKDMPVHEHCRPASRLQSAVPTVQGGWKREIRLSHPGTERHIVSGEAVGESGCKSVGNKECRSGQERKKQRKKSIHR